jgi:hypothetical protein
LAVVAPPPSVGAGAAQRNIPAACHTIFPDGRDRREAVIEHCEDLALEAGGARTHIAIGVQLRRGEVDGTVASRNLLARPALAAEENSGPAGTGGAEEELLLQLVRIIPGGTGWRETPADIYGAERLAPRH